MSDGACGDAGPWNCVTPTHIPGKGEALVAARDLPPNQRILRVAPFAALPYGRFLDTLCSGCLQPCDASPRCSRCAVARHCALCASSFPGRAHAYECHALARLARNERGLTLAHDDLRLLLRVLSRRKDAMDATKAMSTNVRDDDEDGEASSARTKRRGTERDESTESEPVGREPSPRSTAATGPDPFLAAAAEDSDVAADDFASLDALMSGVDGDEDGSLDERALVTIGEVAKQCKFLVAAACRTSEETYARLLGKLQLNGFEITAAAAAAERGAGRAERRRETARARSSDDARGGSRLPVGIGVYPSAARFNHSCEPNCAQRFDAFACVVVDTTRAVAKGEELTSPYVDVTLDVVNRNARLERNFAFRCDCARCAWERAEARVPVTRDRVTQRRSRV